MEATEDLQITGGDTLQTTAEQEVDKSFEVLIHRFNEFRASGHFCDFKLISSDGMSFNTHKILLASRSPYFMKFLDQESHKEMEFSNINSTTLATILTYIYSGRIHKLTQEEAMECWEAGVFLKLDFIVNFCVNSLKSTLDVHNSIPVIFKAHKLNEEKLLKSCIYIIQQSFSNFANIKPNLKGFPVSVLLSILSLLNLDGNEDDVLKIFNLWRTENPTTSEDSLIRLFNCIYLDRLSHKALKSIVKDHCSQQAFSWCIDKVIDMHGKVNQEKALPRRLDERLILVNNFVKQGIISYDLFSRKWEENQGDPSICTPMYSFEHLCEKMHVSFDSEMIVATGGLSDIHDALLSTWIYRFDKKIWSEGPPLIKARNSHISCKYEGNFYVIGGYGAKDSVERLVYKTHGVSRWERVSSLRKGRLLHSCAVLKAKGINSIIVFGGCNEALLESVELYNFQSKKWSTAAPMHKPRLCPMQGVVGNKLYVFSMVTATQKNGEMYDADTDQWSMLKTMNFFPLENKMLERGSVLYGLGKVDLNGSSCVASYDTKEGRWTIINDCGPTPLTSYVMHKLTGYKLDTNYVISRCFEC